MQQCQIEGLILSFYNDNEFVNVISRIQYILFLFIFVKD